MPRRGRGDAFLPQGIHRDHPVAGRFHAVDAITANTLLSVLRPLQLAVDTRLPGVEPPRRRWYGERVGTRPAFQLTCVDRTHPIRVNGKAVGLAVRVDLL